MCAPPSSLPPPLCPLLSAPALLSALLPAPLPLQGVIWKKPGSAEFDIPGFIKSLPSPDSTSVQAEAKPAATAATAADAAADASTPSGGIKSSTLQELEESVFVVLESNAKLSGLLGGGRADWQLQEVGDGNINFVFIVSGPKGTLVVKKVWREGGSLDTPVSNCFLSFYAPQSSRGHWW